MKLTRLDRRGESLPWITTSLISLRQGGLEKGFNDAIGGYTRGRDGQTGGPLELYYGDVPGIWGGYAVVPHADGKLQALSVYDDRATAGLTDRKPPSAWAAVGWAKPMAPPS